MNIEINRRDLLHAIAAADGIARPSTVHSLLECVLVTASDSIVTISATDTVMTIRAQFAGANSKEGSLAIVAKRLREVVKNAPDDKIAIKALDNSWVEIKSGKAKYKLAAIHTRDFPKIQEPGEGASATFDSDVLKTMIDRVLFSISDDKTRMNLNGALFEVGSGTASMMSSDGHRLNRTTHACDGDAFSALVPKEALAKLARIASGEVRLVVEPTRIFAITSGVTMMSPLISDKFPGVDQMLEYPRPHIVTVNREAFVASIERTKIATNDTHGTIIDARTGELMLSSVHPDVGEVSDRIEANGATDAIKSCIAPKYLLEPLSKMTDDEVTLRFAGEFDPVTIENASGYLALVMPMRRS